MACFLAPASAAIITTGIRKKFPSKYHLEWLNAMFLGGVVMLGIEHIARGEVVFFPPFLTAMKTASGTYLMIKEIAITGGVMAVAVIALWALLVFVPYKTAKIRKKTLALCG